MKKTIPFLLVLIQFSTNTTIGQELNNPKLEAHGSDTLPSFDIKEVVIFTKKEFLDVSDRARFERLKRNTIKVYPYVEMAVKLYTEMNVTVDELDRRRQRKRYIKDTEEEIRLEFEEKIKNLSKSQGEILIKLINRETGNSCYDIVKQLKNPVTAFFWQMTGRLFGHNLKEVYIPEENEDLEFIVKMIKNQ